jgi:hypothetical protein
MRLLGAPMAGTSFDSNVLSLSEWGDLSNDRMVKKITYSLLEKYNVLQDIPIMTQATMVMNGMRFLNNLPGSNSRALNSLPTVTKGKPTPYQERAFIIASNQFQIDAKLAKEENAIQDPLQVQVEAWTKSFTYTFNYNFIQNDPISQIGLVNDPNYTVGLLSRINNTALFETNGDMSINGLGGSTVTATVGMTQANANDLVEAIEQIFDYMNVPDGQGVYLYVNDTLRRRIGRAIRLLGAGAGFDTTKDDFGRIVDTFRGAKIRDIGRKADQTTRIIPTAESSTGAQSGGNSTSIYAVKYGPEDFCAWQYEPMKPKNLGLDPTNGVAYNVVVDYALGFWQPNTRAIARLYNIKLA